MLLYVDRGEIDRYLVVAAYSFLFATIILCVCMSLSLSLGLPCSIGQLSLIPYRVVVTV